MALKGLPDMACSHSVRAPQARRRAALPDLESHLRRQARRVTAPRQAILRVLREQARPLTARDILGCLPPGGCDLATVYRSLHLLAGLGIVCRLNFGDGACRFELADDPGDGQHHHHHLICIRCAQVVELDTCGLEEAEQRIAEANGFKAVTHRLEFFGICPGCQSAPPAASAVTGARAKPVGGGSTELSGPAGGGREHPSDS